MGNDLYHIILGLYAQKMRKTCVIGLLRAKRLHTCKRAKCKS